MTERNYKLTSRMWSKTVRELPVIPSLKYIAQGEPTLVEVRDGRTLAVRKRGVDYGVPVIRFHGNPGSSIAPLNPEEDLEKIGIQQISFDRAGSGRSDRHKGLTISDTAIDVLDMLNALDITGKIALMASSGGVSHALATAAHPELRERIAGLVVMAGKAPWEIGTSFEEKATEDNQVIYRAAREDPKALRKKITRRARRVQEDNFNLMTSLYPVLQGDDFIYFTAEGISTAIAVGQADGLRQNGDGWYDDSVALQKPSGFEMSAIQAPTVIWHGLHDPFSSHEESLWLKEQIPHAELILDENAAHFGSLGVTYAALRWLRNHYIGPEHTQQLQDLVDTWLENWNNEFNNNWERFPFARGKYARDDYEARDAIRKTLNKSIDANALAEKHASREVLLQLK